MHKVISQKIRDDKLWAKKLAIRASISNDFFLITKHRQRIHKLIKLQHLKLIKTRVILMASVAKPVLMILFRLKVFQYQ